jgi:membrane protein YdbS with pleckstrin-like domain
MPNKTLYTGVTPMFALFLVFLVLKLTEVISWSWWWVTCPLWAWLSVGLLVLIVMFICIGVQTVLHKLTDIW